MANEINGVLVRLDTQNTHQPQATVMPYATSTSGGAMSPAQAAKLASIPSPLPAAPLPSNDDPLPLSDQADAGSSLFYSRGDHVHPGTVVTDIQTANYDASVREVVQCDTSGGGFNVTFPAISPANRGQMIWVWVDPETAAGSVSILPTGSDTINSGPSESLGSGSMTFVSNGVSNWLKLV